ncbi:MAG: hypothetical protein OHK0017_11410 [Patescibacteria group bacterium]
MPITSQTWEKFKNRIETYLKADESDDEVEDLFTPPVSLVEVEALEEEVGFKFPPDLKEVLTKYTSNVCFGLDLVDPETNDTVFAGPTEGLFDFENIADEIQNWKEWNSWWEDESVERQQLLESIYSKNFIPIIYVGSGDKIGVNADNGNVIYWSHEDPFVHENLISGRVLGEDVADFLDKWSNVLFLGPEDSYLEKVYNFEKNQLDANSEIVQRLKSKYKL